MEIFWTNAVFVLRSMCKKTITRGWKEAETEELSINKEVSTRLVDSVVSHSSR